MICSACNRPIRAPAAQVGRAVFGPKCARRAGLVLPAQRIRRAQSEAVKDDRTQDLFEEITA